MKNMLSTTCFVITTLYGTTAYAADVKPQDLIKYRQSAMMYMRWNMAIMKSELNNDMSNYDKSRMIAAARAVAAVANSGLDSLYTPNSAKGTGWKRTRVAPAYFEQPEKVEKFYKEFTQRAMSLADTVQSSDMQQVKEQYTALFDACKSCHKEYRVKDE